MTFQFLQLTFIFVLLHANKRNFTLRKNFEEQDSLFFLKYHVTKYKRGNELKNTISLSH